jgi:hypothetical protein
MTTPRLRALSTVRLIDYFVCLLAALLMATGWRAYADCTSGNPYCQTSATVPCNGGDCVAWNLVFTFSPPKCQPMVPGSPNISNLDFTDIATSWTTCVVSNDDQDSCVCSGQTCMTAMGFPDDDCVMGDLCAPFAGENIAKPKGGGSSCN